MPAVKNDTPVLTLHHRSINSPFGLIGTNENALTFALGYTFQQCVPLLQWFLKKLDIHGVRTSSLKKATIDLQRRRGDSDKGVTDIEIRLAGQFHVIVEAKVGLGLPTISQCQPYVERLLSADEPVQKLVALLPGDAGEYLLRELACESALFSRLVTLSWPQFIPPCIQLIGDASVSQPSQDWLRAFHSFLDEEYRMKAFTTEVWILAANTKEIGRSGVSHWDIHQQYRVWWDYREHTVRPLYMAFRADGVVDSVWKVNKIEYGMPISELVPELRGYQDHPATIWHFDTPVPLPKPLRTGAGMYNRRVRCDFDLLLTCSTVNEIAFEMAQRRLT